MKNEYIRVFRAFTDESRVRVLEILLSGEQCACVLLHDLNISQPTLSHHMKILCDSGIVKRRRVGKWSYYSINTEGCEYASRLLNAIVKRNMEGTLRVSRYAHRFLRRAKAMSGRADTDGTSIARICC
ncbi:transcriptional regulator, ArsR family [Sporobacter termitidis DSM 10068]|uniref:Transcriptional regulator, ArsR family n=1 Tax=Sporobacter termitidis DSM 10068 TaxID=1123282 RepID=A0A1M5WBB8_9FIRM|nr:transcriptional regulator, ArsR family [Sporobacter termitidis DSM 10068]